MAKYRPIRPERNRPQVPKQGAITCVVIVIGAFVLLFALVIAMFRSN